MNWKQFLTEKVLKECWDADKRPGGDLPNRPYDNRNDLLDLYEAIYRDGKWDDFSGGARWKHTMFSAEDFAEVSEWIFCLGGQGYEDRCKTVAEFYGWREADHD